MAEEIKNPTDPTEDVFNDGQTSGLVPDADVLATAQGLDKVNENLTNGNLDNPEKVEAAIGVVNQAIKQIEQDEQAVANAAKTTEEIVNEAQNSTTELGKNNGFENVTQATNNSLQEAQKEAQEFDKAAKNISNETKKNLNHDLENLKNGFKGIGDGLKQITSGAALFTAHIALRTAEWSWKNLKELAVNVITLNKTALEIGADKYSHAINNLMLESQTSKYGILATAKADLETAIKTLKQEKTMEERAINARIKEKVEAKIKSKVNALQRKKNKADTKVNNEYRNPIAKEEKAIAELNNKITNAENAMEAAKANGDPEMEKIFRERLEGLVTSKKEHEATIKGLEKELLSKLGKNFKDFIEGKKEITKSVESKIENSSSIKNARKAIEDKYNAEGGVFGGAGLIVKLEKERKKVEAKITKLSEKTKGRSDFQKTEAKTFKETFQKNKESVKNKSHKDKDQGDR